MGEFAGGTASGEWRTLRAFGITIRTDYPLKTYMLPGDGEPELTFTCERRALEGAVAPPGEAAYRSAVKIESGEPFLSVYPGEDHHLMRFAEVADFFLHDDAIECHMLDPDYAYMVEIHLMGIVLSLWFELRGTPMVHAAAVVVDDRAVGFTATNRGGKSSLAGTLMQAGYPLLTDDLLRVEERGNRLLGHPGYPQMRLWPDQAEHFMGSYEELDIVHPRLDKRRVRVGTAGRGNLNGSGRRSPALGEFCDEPRELGCLFLPERREAVGGNGDGDGDGAWAADGDADQAIDIRPVPAGEAVIELIRGSFLPQPVESLGLQGERLRFFGRLVGSVPMYRISYPTGVDHLPRVREAILEAAKTAGEAGNGSVGGSASGAANGTPRAQP